MSPAELGTYPTIVCFKAAIAQMEEACLRKGNRDTRSVMPPAYRTHRTTAAVAVKTLPIDRAG